MKTSTLGMKQASVTSTPLSGTENATQQSNLKLSSHKHHLSIVVLLLMVMMLVVPKGAHAKVVRETINFTSNTVYTPNVYSSVGSTRNASTYDSYLYEQYNLHYSNDFTSSTYQYASTGLNIAGRTQNSAKTATFSTEAAKIYISKETKAKIRNAGSPASGYSGTAYFKLNGTASTTNYDYSITKPVAAGGSDMIDNAFNLPNHTQSFTISIYNTTSRNGYYYGRGSIMYLYLCKLIPEVLPYAAQDYNGGYPLGALAKDITTDKQTLVIKVADGVNASDFDVEIAKNEGSVGTFTITDKTLNAAGTELTIKFTCATGAVDGPISANLNVSSVNELDDKEYTVAISGTVGSAKEANTLAWDIPTSQFVNTTYAQAVFLANVNSTENITITSSNTDVCEIINGGASIRFKAAGTVTLRAQQAENADYEGADESITVTVSKRTATFAYAESTLFIETEYPGLISVTNDPNGTLLPNLVYSGADTYMDVDEDGTVTTNTKRGNSVTLNITFPGNTEWNAVNESHTFKIVNKLPAPPFCLVDLDNILERVSDGVFITKETNGSFTWNGSALQVTTTGNNYTNITIRFDGIPNKVSFTPDRALTNLSIYESEDGTGWTSLPGRTPYDASAAANTKVELAFSKSGARYLQIRTRMSGGGTVDLNDLCITSKPTFTVSPPTVTIPTDGVLSTPQTVTVVHNDMRSITITSSDPDFVVSPLTTVSGSPIGEDNQGTAQATVDFVGTDLTKTATLTLTGVPSSGDNIVKTVTARLNATHATHYALGRAIVASESGSGRVYVGNNSTEPAANAYSSSSERLQWCSGEVGANDNLTFHYWAQAAEGYEFEGWYGLFDEQTLEYEDLISSSEHFSIDLTAYSTDQDNPTTGTLYAVFAEATAAAAPVFALEALNLGSVVSSPDAMLEGALVLQPVGEALRPLYIDREQTTIAFSDIAGHEGESALFAAGSYSSGAKSFAITFTPTGLHPTTHNYQTLATVTAKNEKGTTTRTAVISATVNPSPAATYTLDASHTFSNLQRNQHETWNAVLGSLTNDVGTPTISITGTNAAMFSAGAYDATNHLFPITFAPTAVGNNYTATATITVLNYDGVQTQKTITLTGTCVVSPLASFDVQNADGESVVNASGVYYGDFNVGDLTSTRTFYIKNLTNMKEGSTPSISISPADIFSASAYNPTLNTFAISFTAVEGMTTVQNAVATFTVLNNDDVETEKQVPLSAFVVVPVDFDVRVTSSTGTVLKEGTWAEGLEEANKTANAGCTLTLMRNITGLTTYQTVTNTFTLDLNGKRLSGKSNGSIIYVNASGKTLTIKDSKGSGIIENINNTYAGIAYGANVNAGTLVLHSGTIYVENKGTSGRKAVGIQNKLNTNITINGGKVEVYGYNDSYGIYQGSDAGDNMTFTMNNGEVTIEGATNIMGVYARGNVNINGGVINATATSRYSYGIRLYATANATATNCVWGKLNMTGGTINSICNSDANAARETYGVYFDCNNAAMGTLTATDGSHTNKAAAIGTISNATINATTYGNTAYGIIAYGSYNSKTSTYDVIRVNNSTINATAKYYNAYGVYATGGVDATNNVNPSGTTGAVYFANIELTDCEVNATVNTYTTAYAVWATTGSGTIYKDKQPNYYGEYAGGATVTINSGTYTATTGTTNAYAVGTSARAKTIYGSETSVYAERTLGGNAEGYATLNIHGGTFRANAGTTTARAVSNGGNCTINGGEFYATTGTSTAYGLYTVSGKLKATGIKVDVTAGTGTAYGIVVDAAGAPTGNQAWTGFTYHGDAELNNLDVTVKTSTATEARGVFVNATTTTYTRTAFENQKKSSQWADATTYAAYNAVFPGDKAYASAGKVVINGGIYTINAATTTAYGVYLAQTSVSANKSAIAAAEATIKNATFDVSTNGTTSAYGIRSGGDVTIDGCNIKVQPKTTTAYGVYMDNNTATITNTTLDVKGTTTVYALYANASINSTNGYDYHGRFDLGAGNDFTAAATAGNIAHVMTLIAAKRNIASGDFAGDYANAATAVIRDGKYKATATGTTTYVLNLSDNQVQGAVSAAPSCTVEGGKFWAKATGGTEGICTTNAVVGNIVFNGGYYNISTNLAKYVADGSSVITLTGGQEFSEGYQYTIGKGSSGNIVCKVFNNNGALQQSYATLEEALQFVNSNTGTEYVIVMVADYKLAAGDYRLPSKATLVVPKSLTQTKVQGTTPNRVTGAPAPVQLVQLTFLNGVNMTIYGKIETNADNTAANGGSAITGAPTGNFGRLHIEKGAKIDLESGSEMRSWGYVTGKGEINAKKGSILRESFQLGYWRGGTATTKMISNASSWHAFPVDDYYYQNIECPITYHPGSKAYGYSGVNVSIIGVQAANDVQLVGTTGDNAMFLMDNAAVSELTYVKKEYFPDGDTIVWTVASGAKLGNLHFSLAGKTVKSEDYYLPVTSNMIVNVEKGDFTITQDALIIPGGKICIAKEGKVIVTSGKKLFIDDGEDRQKVGGNYYYPVLYSPSWPTKTNPRTQYRPRTAIQPDGEIFVHGETEGSFYTSTKGANIHSTNPDAGKVKFVAAAGANTSIKQIINTDCDLATINFTTAQLRNEITATPYTSTEGASAGDAYIYMEKQWVRVKDGCLTERTDGSGTHYYYANPSDVIEVEDNDDHAYKDKATGTRFFIFAEKPLSNASCVWWEATKTTINGTTYYVANQEKYDNFGTHFYWDESAGYWKPYYVTVTWKQSDGTTIDTYSNVPYGTRPIYNSASPTIPNTTTTAKYAWIGWTDGSNNFYERDGEMPIVTSNTTFTAKIEETKIQYLITFKNSDGSPLEAVLWSYGEKPSYSGGTPTQSSTASQTYTFSSWNPQITEVSAAKTYTAQYSETTRQYDVTFLNYDNAKLETKKVNYNVAPTYTGTPSTPERTDPEDYYIYEFTGWKNQLTGTTGLAAVTSDQTYVAQYNHYQKWFNIRFVDYNGTTLQTGPVLRNTMPTPPVNPTRESDAQYHYTFKAWSPAITKATENKTYTATYNTTLRSYTVRFLGYDKTVLQTETLNYGVTPSYKGSTPTKPGNVQYHYDFIGWDDVMRTVSGDKDYTAQFDEVTNQYAITFKNYDGTVLKNDEQDYGIRPQAPVTPSKPDEGNYSYVFAGWVVENTVDPVYASDALPLINGIATYVATYNEVYNKPSYTITFLDPEQSGDDKTVYTTTVLEGEALADPAATLIANGKLQKAEDAGYTYVFDTWTPALVSPVTAEATYTATYRIATTKQYTIAFYDENGTELQSGSVSYGTPPTPPAAPTKESDKEWDYSFDWWYVGDVKAANPLPAVSGAVSYTARYSKTHRRFTATFVDEDGTVLETVNNVEYGKTPVFTSATPTKATDEDYTYTFAGWSPALGNITSDATFTATYTAQERLYGEDYRLDIVDWSDNGSSQTITLNMNGYSLPTVTNGWVVSVNGNTYNKENRSANRTLTISGLTLTADDMLTIKVRGAGNECVSRLHYRIPFVYARNTDLSSWSGSNESSIYVKAGRLRVNTNVSANEIIVGQGAELLINSGKTVSAESLILRTTAFSSAVLTNNGSLNATKTYYSRIVSDKSQAFQIGFPFDANLSNTIFSNGKDATQGTHYAIMYYDGESRATNGKAGLNWLKLTSNTMSGKTGYQIISSSAYYYEILFPFTLTSVSNGESISVYAYGDESDSEKNRGWNYLTSSYTSVYNCGTPANVEDAVKIAILGTDNETYTQDIVSQIQPAIPFFYQATTDGSLVFTEGNLHKNMPSRMPKANQTTTQWIRLLLEQHTASYQIPQYSDVVNIYVSDKFTSEYERGYDVEKLSTEGNIPLIWTSLKAGDLAFAAIPDSDALNIPISVFSPTPQKMVFSLQNNDNLDRTEYLILIDTETGQETDIINDYYICNIPEGITTGRFYLSTRFRQKDIGTDTENIRSDADNLQKPQKVFIDGYIYILMPNGEIYDAVGKKIE